MFSPLVRISFGLTMLTVSLLLISEFIGLVPNNEKAELDHRKWVTESLAVQLSTAVYNKREFSIQETLDSVVEKNPSVLSAAVRDNANEIIMVAGYHDFHWNEETSKAPTAKQTQISIYGRRGQWGSLELSFTPLQGGFDLTFKQGSFWVLIGFVALVGFFCYMFFLKKAVHELNADDVIPERVGSAFDTLTEGILIIDSMGFIVFSNEAFATMTGFESKEIVGLRANDFEWGNEALDDENLELPWNLISTINTTVKGEQLTLKNRHGRTYTLTVNATSIGQEKEKVQGILATFDDMSDMETKHRQLSHALSTLRAAKNEVTEQNRQLQILATRDPLTNVLNRRSLFSGLEALLSESYWGDTELCCLMVDIDHFKAVNDTYGHGVGDKIIVFVAQCLSHHSRSLDLVARFGGEEFCVVMPNTALAEAQAIAEDIRQSIESGKEDSWPDALAVCASLGVSSSQSSTAADAESLIEQADQALYYAKEHGRNQVVCWSPEKMEATEPKVRSTQATQQAKPRPVELPLQIEPEPAAPLLSNESALSTEQYKDILLLDRIDQAINRSGRYGTQFAVLAMDIEMLQHINDTLGPTVGKKMLHTISARLQTTLRKTDSILTGHEEDPIFSISATGHREIVLLLTDLEETNSLHAVTNRIAKSQTDPLIIEGEEYIYNTKMGVSVYPRDGSDALTLLKNANIAKSHAIKNITSENVSFFSEEIEKQSQRMIKLGAELFRTIERDELVLFYQPKACLKTGKLVGFEALIRWQHPTRGLVPPHEFIPIAESTGLITELSQWVVRTACRQVKNWKQQGYGDIQISLNLSPIEFRNRNLAEKIMGAVLEFGIPPHCLEVEITETIAVDDMQLAVDTLNELAASGIEISVDDFGTGYASLRYLQSLPIKKFKIDKLFIDDLLGSTNSSSLISAVIAMGHTLGFEVIAEGVETLEQMQYLQDMHCDQIQGYFLSRPVPREQAEILIEDFSQYEQRILESRDVQRNNAAFSGGVLKVINKMPEHQEDLNYPNVS